MSCRKPESNTEIMHLYLSNKYYEIAEYEDCAEMCTNMEPSLDPESEMVIDNEEDSKGVTLEQLEGIGELVGVQPIPEEPKPGTVRTAIIPLMWPLSLS